MTNRKTDTHTDYMERAARNRQRRNRQLRRRLTVGILSLSAMLSIFIFAFAGTRSDAQSAPQLYKYYRSVIVLPSDTVETMASVKLTDTERIGISDAESYASEIRSINHLSFGEQPLAGTSLIIPYYSLSYVE